MKSLQSALQTSFFPQVPPPHTHTHAHTLCCRQNLHNSFHKNEIKIKYINAETTGWRSFTGAFSVDILLGNGFVMQCKEEHGNVSRGLYPIARSNVWNFESDMKHQIKQVRIGGEGSGKSATPFGRRQQGVCPVGQIQTALQSRPLGPVICSEVQIQLDFTDALGGRGLAVSHFCQLLSLRIQIQDWSPRNPVSEFTEAAFEWLG